MTYSRQGHQKAAQNATTMIAMSATGYLLGALTSSELRFVILRAALR